MVYTDGACTNNGKANARCGSGVWIAPDHHGNKAIRVPGDKQSNQIGEITAAIAAIESIPSSWPLKIVTDSKYLIEGLTTHLKPWEDQGWIGIKNTPFFKRAAYLLRRRTATTTFQWVKGHEGNQGNEESDRLAKEGMGKDEPDALELSIPKNFDPQGAKLAVLTQAMAYKGIQEQKEPYTRRTTANNLNRARVAIESYGGELETDETIWKSLRNPTFRPRIQQFLYKAMHGTHKIGDFWANIPNYEDRQDCLTCHTTETMSHILIECNSSAVRIIWNLARTHWPHANIPWPNVDLGTILGCGSASFPPPPRTDGEIQPRQRKQKGAMRLLQILITESAYLIWTTRCERVIQEKIHSEAEIKAKWQRAINKRLTDDKIIATRIRRDQPTIRKVKSTWESVLKQEGDLPNDWIYNREVLVGRRQGSRPHREP